MERIIQIGVIGACADLDYTESAQLFAIELGRAIAKNGYTLVFGAEKDIPSLPQIAAKAARQAGGNTVGITYDKGLDVFDNEACSMVICTGLVRGGGRETVLMLSCDVVIAIAGGSGTLNEICIAYQANIPVIVVSGFGGWSDELGGKYLDERRRYRFRSVTDPDEAVSNAISQLRGTVR